MRRLTWRRVLDLNDRALRHVVVGLGGPLEGVPRETGFDITPASEIMAALCLAEDFDDLRRRLARLIVGFDREGKPLWKVDLGPMAAAYFRVPSAEFGFGSSPVIHGGKVIVLCDVLTNFFLAAFTNQGKHRMINHTARR